MKIQRLAPTEWRRYRHIRMQALQNAPDAFGTTLEEAAERSEADWRKQLETLATFVAVVNDHDAGTVRGAPHDADPASAYLISMWVTPQFRGCGVGKQLINSVIAWARAAGYSRLLLDVADENHPTVELYARMGFTPTDESGSLPPPRAHVSEHQRALSL